MPNYPHCEDHQYHVLRSLDSMNSDCKNVFEKNKLTC